MTVDVRAEGSLAELSASAAKVALKAAATTAEMAAEAMAVLMEADEKAEEMVEDSRVGRWEEGREEAGMVAAATAVAVLEFLPPKCPPEW